MRLLDAHWTPCGVHILRSEDRKRERRKRREQKRRDKRAERLKDCTLENVADMDNLYRAAMKAKNGVSWKASVQRYHKDLLSNISKARRDLLQGADIRRGFYHFSIFERGKLRHISSVHFSERVIHKSLSVNALVPALTPSFIRNNTANTEGRGTDDALKRLKRDLARHYRKHGADGYILLIDFSNYFGSIAHEPLKRIVRNALDDDRIVRLVFDQIDACGDVGLGLGSEPNQIMAVAFASPIDHFVTEMLGVEGYGRYMDDSYCIHTSKEYLQAVLACIEQKCSEIGITINRKKTHIVKLSHGFTWLKKKISYGENGRIVMRPCRESVTRERRKLKKLRRLVDEGRLTLEQVERSYQSWRGSMLRLDSWKTVQTMDALYRDLFGSDEENSLGGGLNAEDHTETYPPPHYYLVVSKSRHRAAFFMPTERIEHGRNAEHPVRDQRLQATSDADRLSGHQAF